MKRLPISPLVISLEVRGYAVNPTLPIVVKASWQLFMRQTTPFHGKYGASGLRTHPRIPHDPHAA